jgi:hypothetical protein
VGDKDDTGRELRSAEEHAVELREVAVVVVVHAQKPGTRGKEGVLRRREANVWKEKEGLRK